MKKLLLILSICFAYGCSEDIVSTKYNNNSSSTEDKQKILSNNISKVALKGDSIFVFTDLGYSVVKSINDINSLFSFENDVSYGYKICYLIGQEHIYTTYTDTKDSTITTKVFSDGNLYNEVNQNWVIKHSTISATVEMAEKSDTLYSAMPYSGVRINTGNKCYLSLIDTIKGNIKEYPKTADTEDTTDIFYRKNFKDHITGSTINNINGVKIFNNKIIAQTWGGIYTSTDGDVWHKNEFMKNKAKECIESSEGFVNNKKIFYAMYRSKINNPSWDTIYTGENKNHGLYVSDDNLETFTYFPKFKDKMIGEESFRAMSSHKNKIIIATTDSVYAGVFDGASFIWKSMSLSSVFASTINSVAINDSLFLLGSDNVGVIYSKDFENWSFLSRNKIIENDLKEVYAYPSIITRKNPITTFAYRLKDDDNVTIEIFDYNGDLVKTVICNQKRNKGYNLLKSTILKYDNWNGTDNNNKNVKPGTYRFKITTLNTKKEAWGQVVVGVL